MKKILLFIILFLCSTTSLFAQDFSFVDKNKNTILVTTTATTAAFSIANTQNTYINRLSVWGSQKSDLTTLIDKVYERLDYGNNKPINKIATRFTVSSLTPGHKYYLELVNSSNAKARDVFEFTTPAVSGVDGGIDSSPKYPLTAQFNITENTIDVKMTGAPNDQSKYQLYNGVLAVGDTTWIKTATAGTVTWQLSGAQVTNNTQYNFHVKKIPTTTSFGLPIDVTDTKQFVVGTPAPGPSTDAMMTVSVTSTSSTSVAASGKIPSQTPDLYVKFEWSTSANAAGEPTNGHHLFAGGTDATVSIASDGTYSLPITNLSPSDTYYFKVSLLLKGKNEPMDTKVGTFTTQKGFLAPGSVGESLDFNSRSYHLLAPWPGLSVLMDPDLCLQKKADGSVPQDAICDVNGFLNFAFKMLIGLTAVILVLRLMYEGYQYVVTDVPFLKASAKSDFKTALFGLLLALSSYVILNTINPKLVDNQISIDSVDVGVMPLSEGGQYRLTQTQTAVGAKKFARSSYYDQLKTISAQYGIPHCLMQVAIQRESSGGAGAKLVGHDEDVASNGIRSRREFIASGIKFNKSTFTAGAGIGDKKIMNTDHGTPYHAAPNPNAADLGLDWRFSHSIGLFGVTFGPNNLPISGAKAVYDSVAVDMGIAAKTMTAFYNKCSKNVEWTWRAYASGSCKGGTNGSSDLFVNKETPIRVDLYNQCVAQDN